MSSTPKQSPITGNYSNCKFRNFRENFIFAISIQRHICDVKNSRHGHDIRRSVNNRVILPNREGFTFTKLRIKPSQKFQNLQFVP